MTTLPVSGYLSNAARTVGEEKQGLEDLRSVVAELLGGQAVTTLTLALDTITPTAGIHQVDTEAQATTDNLATIVQTNIPDGRLLLFRIVTDGRTVVVKHAIGGVGQILLAGAADFTMESTTKWLLLKRTGTIWEEVIRFYGSDKAAARTFLGAQAQNAGLDAIAALTHLAGRRIVSSGSAWVADDSPFDGVRNKIIDGDFELWDAGTSFTISGYWATMWRGNVGGGATISRQAFTPGQTAVPGEPRYYLSHNRTVAAAGQNDVLVQAIEGVRNYAGQTITLSFYAKAAATKVLSVQLIQSFGTGGTPSADVGTAAQTVNLTTSWQKFAFTFAVPSIAGKTLGTNNNDFLAIRIFEDPTFSTFTADFARVKIDLGSVATPFERRGLALEKLLAARYFVQINELVSATYVTSGWFQSTVSARYILDLGVPMRTIPTYSVKTIGDFRCQGSSDFVPTATALLVGTATDNQHLALSFTVSGATAGQGAGLYMTSAGSNNWMQFDARL